MKVVSEVLARPRLWPVGVALLAALVLLPRLGSYGFWEPQEIGVAEKVLERIDSADQADDADEGADEGADAETPPRRSKRPSKDQGFELDTWLIAHSVDASDLDEGSARLPLALLGVVIVLCTYFLGLRLGSARAGFIAAVVMLSFPLFAFQARQLTGELGVTLGAVLVMLGFAGLAWPRPGETAVARGLDVLIVAVGAAVGYAAGGPWLGVAVPFGAAAIAALALGLGDRAADNAPDDDDTDDDERPGWPLWLAAGLAAAVATAAFAYFLHEVFTIVDAAEGDRALFGKTLQPAKGFVDVLGDSWRPKGDRKVTFEALFAQIAFGVFPWIALAPLAVARLGMGQRSRRATFAGYLLVAWSAAALITTSILARKVGPVLYPALPAIAVAIALWIDSLLAARDRDDAARSVAAPLVALFALFAIVVIGKDIRSFPELFLSLHLETPVREFPEGVSLASVVAALGIVCGLCIAAGLAFWQRRPLPGPAGSLERWLAGARRTLGHGLYAALGLSVVFSLVLTQVWTPRLSTKLSSRQVFSTYRDLREPGDLLGLQGRAGAGPRFYSGGSFELLQGRGDLLEFLQRPQRVFALARAAEMCAVHKESGKKGFDYYVIDDSNADLVLLSNKMWHGDPAPPPSLHASMRTILDDNLLARHVSRERPTNIQHPLDVNFDDTVKLIGYDMPSQVERGDTFEVTLYYQVQKAINRNWKIFVHFDSGSMRFQGDHDPVDGQCGTSYWQPGDYIVDRFEVEAGDVSYPKKSYRVWTGFFVGSGGNWENMEALSGNPDEGDRVPIGSISVR